MEGVEFLWSEVLGELEQVLGGAFDLIPDLFGLSLPHFLQFKHNRIRIPIQFDLPLVPHSLLLLTQFYHFEQLPTRVVRLRVKLFIPVEVLYF